MRSFKTLITIVIFLLIVSKALGQTNATVESPQYLFDNFSKGKVLMKNKELQPAVMNYNTVTEKMVYEHNGELLSLINFNVVDTIYLQDSKFIPVGKVFHELIETSPIPLFIQHRRKLLPPGKNVGFGQTSELSSSYSLSSLEHSSNNYNLAPPSDYKVKNIPVYWLMKDGKMVSFSNVRQLQKLFPKKKREINALIKEEKLNLEKKDDLVKIIIFCAKEKE